jgi:outer membrane protein OmpA-like peptidoglycan-associated protein
MNVRTLLLGTAAALSLSAAGAQAAPFHGWYVSVEGGADWVQDSDFVNHFVGKSSFADRYSYKTGWAALASLGYSFNSHWRVEGEVGYRSNDVDQMFFAGHPSNVNGTLKELTLMANAIYDIPLTEKLDFSIGAGIGADNARLKSNVPANHFSDDTWDFAYQGIAGLNYQIGRRSQLFLNYRYLTVESPTFTHGPNEYDFDDLHKHTVTIGLRYDLSPDEEPAPPPPPPPPPMPQMEPTQFVIFFGFNKCNITSEADGVLSEAASSAKQHGSASVEIVGHTDTVGSPKYNQKLSECRAHAAAKNLEGKGVPAGAIQTSGKGENDLLIQTGDGVKEPQNRRDTITLH